MGRLNRVKWCLLGCLIVGLVFIGVSVVQPGRLTNAVAQIANSDFAYKLRAVTEGGAVDEYHPVEVVIDTVGVSKVDSQPIVVLKEKAGERCLIISIGLAEANAIAVITEGVDVPRPLTSDLLYSILNRLGTSVKSIIITDLREGTFYANIILRANGTEMKIDSRPSDAIALAVRAQAPIFADESVLERAGIWLDKESGKLLPEETEPGKKSESKKVIEDELKKKASAFYDFINTIDLDDFDKRKS